MSRKIGSRPRRPRKQRQLPMPLYTARGHRKDRVYWIVSGHPYGYHVTRVGPMVVLVETFVDFDAAKKYVDQAAADTRL